MSHVDEGASRDGSQDEISVNRAAAAIAAADELADDIADAATRPFGVASGLDEGWMVAALDQLRSDREER